VVVVVDLDVVVDDFYWYVGGVCCVLVCFFGCDPDVVVEFVFYLLFCESVGDFVDDGFFVFVVVHGGQFFAEGGLQVFYGVDGFVEGVWV